MRFSAFLIAAFCSVALGGWPQHAGAQNDRDFVFTDDEGHLVLRFAGAKFGGLTEDQMDEIVNVQLSTMVHDRLRADALFEAEPIDSEWAHSIATRLDKRLSATIPGISALHVECRSASCRLLLEHAGGRRVSEHQSIMDVVQRAIEAFIAANPASFEPVFLIAAHYKEPGNPYVKVFLHRATDRPETDQRAGS